MKMTPIIGIIARKGLSSSGQNILICYDDIISAITKSGGVALVIPDDNIYPYLNICKGFILQGGDDVSASSLKILKVLTKKNVPLFGICLGMQEMALLNGGKLYHVTNHKGKMLHEVTIKKNSLLYNILGVTKTIVNSRHKDAVLGTNSRVSGVSMDNVIEAIEDDNLTFFLGVQWHPENMYDTDINSRKIFDYFVKICDDYCCK